MFNANLIDNKPKEHIFSWHNRFYKRWSDHACRQVILGNNSFRVLLYFNLPKIIHDNLPKVKPHWMSLILLEISCMQTKSQKLHIQFTCTSKVDYWNLLLILENICEESEVYEKMASLKPVVGLALAKLFNQVRSAWISKITYKTKHGFCIWLIQEGCTLQYI